jgi:hypothetical protein
MLKKTKKEVQKELLKYGYDLLSNYKGAHEKIQIRCSKGHEYWVTWSNFQQGKRCPKCNGGVKLDEIYVKKEIEKEGYKLLSKYKSNNTKVNYHLTEEIKDFFLQKL